MENHKLSRQFTRGFQVAPVPFVLLVNWGNRQKLQLEHIANYRHLLQMVFEPMICGQVMQKKISIDQYISRIRGRHGHTAGKKSKHEQLSEGKIFYDRATQFITLQHQISLWVGETIYAWSINTKDTVRSAVLLFVIIMQIICLLALSNSKMIVAFKINISHFQESVRIIKIQWQNVQFGQ